MLLASGGIMFVVRDTQLSGYWLSKKLKDVSVVVQCAETSYEYANRITELVKSCFISAT